MVFVSLFLVPVLDGVAFKTNAWLFNPDRNLKIVIAGDVLETYVFTLIIVSVISLAVYSWSYYEDRGWPILRTSLQDVFSGKYAVWRKKRTKV